MNDKTCDCKSSAVDAAIEMALTDAGLSESEKLALFRLQESASPEQRVALGAVLQHLWRFALIRRAITTEFVP